MKLKNKVAVITGAAVGIGRGTAIKFAEEGARLALIDMNRETLDLTASEPGDTALTRTPRAVTSLARALVKEMIAPLVAE